MYMNHQLRCLLQCSESITYCKLFPPLCIDEISDFLNDSESDAILSEIPGWRVPQCSKHRHIRRWRFTKFVYHMRTPSLRSRGDLSADIQFVEVLSAAARVHGDRPSRRKPIEPHREISSNSFVSRVVDWITSTSM